MTLWARPLRWYWPIAAAVVLAGAAAFWWPREITYLEPAPRTEPDPIQGVDGRRYAREHHLGIAWLPAWWGEDQIEAEFASRGKLVIHTGTVLAGWLVGLPILLLVVIQAERAGVRVPWLSPSEEE